MRLATLGTIRLRTTSVDMMAHLLEREGLSARRMFELANVPESVIISHSERISGLQELACQQAFFRLTEGAPDLWMELGYRYGLLHHADSAYGLTMATSQNMQVALEAGLRLPDLRYSLLRPLPKYKDNKLVGFLSFWDEVSPEMMRFTIIRDLASMRLIFMDLWGQEFSFKLIAVPLEPSDHKILSKIFPSAEIVCNADRMEIGWEADLREVTPFDRDDIAHRAFLAACEQSVTDFNNMRDPVLTMFKMMRATPAAVSLAAVAKESGLSCRSLQRELSRRGLSFRQLTGLTRCKLACEKLSDSSAKVSEIAMDVGYDDIASFNLAFRKYMGMTPISYRKYLSYQAQGRSSKLVERRW